MKVDRCAAGFSPSGCTFWGKKPWSRKKKILWQLGTLVGAPVGIALIAGIAIPAMIIGIPVYVGRKVRQSNTEGKSFLFSCFTHGQFADESVCLVLSRYFPLNWSEYSEFSFLLQTANLV